MAALAIETETTTYPQSSCMDCDAPTIPKRTWIRADRDLRELWSSLGWKRAAGAQRCTACLKRLERAGERPRRDEPAGLTPVEARPAPCHRCGIETTAEHGVCVDCKDVVTHDEYVNVWSV